MRAVRIRVAHSDRLFMSFFLGIAAGTAAAGWLGPELLSQMGHLDLQSHAAAAKEAGGHFWRYILRRRLAEFAMGCLVCMTPAAVFGALGLFFCGGFFCALLMMVLTMQDGFRGVLDFAGVLLPQWLLYAPVWIVLAVSADQGLARLRLRMWMGMAAAVLAGTFLEAFVNPLLL